MADPAAPAKDKKKRKSEVKKSDLPGAKKATDGPKPVIKAEVEVESVEEKPKEKKPRPILKVANVEVEVESSTPAPVPQVEVDVQETISLPKAKKPALKPVATVEVTDEPPKPARKPVFTAEVEVDEEEPTVKPPPLRPVVSVEVDDELPFPARRASYVPPKAATKRDIDLLYDLENEKIAELKEAFHLFDLNNDGYIDKEDLKNTYVTLGKADIRDDEIQQMLSEAINPLDFDAFVILLGYKSIELDPEEVLLEALSQWDYDNSGLIAEEKIKHDLTMWGDRFTQEEVEMALEDAPVFYRQDTGQSMIDYVKFCKILCGLRKKPKMPQPGDFVLPK